MTKLKTSVEYSADQGLVDRIKDVVLVTPAALKFQCFFHKQERRKSSHCLYKANSHPGGCCTSDRSKNSDPKAKVTHVRILNEFYIQSYGQFRSPRITVYTVSVLVDTERRLSDFLSRQAQGIKTSFNVL